MPVSTGLRLDPLGAHSASPDSLAGSGEETPGSKGHKGKGKKKRDKRGKGWKAKQVNKNGGKRDKIPYWQVFIPTSSPK